MLNLDAKQQQNIVNKMAKAIPKWKEQIENSFMSDTFKEQYKTMILERMNRIQ
jgi:serine/threonine-protein kinase HipA